MFVMREVTWVVVAVGLAACSKSPNAKKEPEPVAKAGSSAGSNTDTPSASKAGSSAGSSAAANEGSAAAPARPTNSATGTLELTGSVTGSFHWNTKGELICAWHADKKIGGVHMELTDGADHQTLNTGKDLMAATDDDVDARDLTLSIDAHPPARMDIIFLDLPGPMKTGKGFKVTGADDEHMKLEIDTTLTEVVVDPDAPKKKSSKKAKKPAGPKVTIKGTLELTCPKK